MDIFSESTQCIYGPSAFLWNTNFRYIDSETEQAQWSIVNDGWEYQPAFAALQAMPKAGALDALIVNSAGFEPEPILDGLPAGSAPVQIPEPVTVILFGSGLAGIMGYVRNRNQKMV